MPSKSPEASIDQGGISRRRFLAGATAAAVAVTAGSATSALSADPEPPSRLPGKPRESSSALALAVSPATASYLSQIKHGDTAARTLAVKQGPLIGTEAVLPLGVIAAGSDPAAAKAASEALKKIVYNAGRPGADAEAGAASEQLLRLTAPEYPRAVRSQAIELLGIVGSANEAGALAALLNDPVVGEDARLALQRIPGKPADDALRGAARRADAGTRAAIDLSLRQRRLKRSELGVKR